MNRFVSHIACLGLLTVLPALPSLAQQSEPIQAPIATTETTIIQAPVKKPLKDWTDAEVKALGQGIVFPHALLDSVLSKYVNKEGQVMYVGLKGDPDLALYVRALSLADVSQFPVFKEKDENGNEVVDRTAELAFWINAYNGLFLQAVGDSYPVDSISQIKNFDAQKTRVVGGTNYSFAELRQKAVALDPRALFVMIDGRLSGPRAPLAAARFSGLGSQLNAAIQAFINDPAMVQQPNRLQNEVTVSPWLREVDKAFASKSTRRKYTGLRYLLAAYTANSADRRYFSAGDYEFKFMPEKKGLNEFISRS